jgi:IMP dehydrogenase
MVRWIRTIDRKVVVIAGNVATKDAALRLWIAGASAVKVGVGPGSLCTTRIETGCGVPQLTALMDVHEARERYMGSRTYIYGRDGGAKPVPPGIIADGGIKNAGDAVKALCFADMVMCGNVFAGCVETGSTIYRGSSTHKTSHVEGVQARVSSKGPYARVLHRMLEGIRSGCSYQGAALVQQLQNEPEFVKITSAGLRESYPHDVVVASEE